MKYITAHMVQRPGPNKDVEDACRDPQSLQEIGRQGSPKDLADMMADILRGAAEFGKGVDVLQRFSGIIKIDLPNLWAALK